MGEVRISEPIYDASQCGYYCDIWDADTGDTIWQTKRWPTEEEALDEALAWEEPA